MGGPIGWPVAASHNRAATPALIAIIVMVMHASDVGFAAIISMTKNQPPRLTEPIIIFNPSPYINPKSSYSGPERLSFIVAQGWRSAFDFSFRGNHNPPRLDCHVFKISFVTIV